jgi:hypothetical protein
MPRSTLCLYLVVFFLLALIRPCPAQPPDSLWHRTFGGDDPDYGRSARQVHGGYITVGFARSFGGIDYDIYLVRADDGGDTLWTRTYGGAGDDVAQSVRPTSDGGYVIAGYTESFGAGGYDAYLVKTDSGGDTVWTRTYGARGDDYAYAVCEMAHGGYLLAGYSDSYSSDYDFLLIKVNSGGDSIWVRTYGGAGADQCHGFDVTSDGGCVLVGSSVSFTSPTFDVLAVKTDADGDSLWMRNYGGTGNDYGHSIRETADQGYIVTGSIDLGGTLGHQAYLLRLRAGGAPAWEKAYGGGAIDAGYDVEELPGDGGYIICGYTTSYGGGQEDIYLIRAEADGDTLWTGTYGDSLREWGFEVEQTPDGGFIIAGSAMSYPPPAGDNLYLLKTRPDPAGVYGPAVRNGNHITVTAYPSPSAAGVAIEYSLPAGAPARIAVFDLRGRLVRELLPSETEAGWNTTQWDARDHAGNRVAPGIYFLKITAPGGSAVQKMVLTR